MGQIGDERSCCSKLLTCNRELLVSKLRSVQCILDNLLALEFLCEEDVEIVQRTATKPDQVGHESKRAGLGKQICKTPQNTLKQAFSSYFCTCYCPEMTN